MANKFIKSINFGGDTYKFLPDIQDDTLGQEWMCIQEFYDIMTNVEYANGLYVATISENGIWYSNDGMHWMQSNVTDYTYVCLSHGNNMWVATCDKGIMYSLDGMTWQWTHIYAGSGAWSFLDVSCLHFANNMWVAHGDSTMADMVGGEFNESIYGPFYSTDGITWYTKETLDISAGVVGFDITYGDGVWVMGTSNGIVYSTDNAVNWQMTDRDISEIYKVSYANGVFVAVDYFYGVWYSHNGINWTQSNLVEGNCFRYLYCADDGWVITFDSYDLPMCYSTDGIFWTKCNIVDGYGEKFDNVTKINDIWFAGTSWELSSGIYYSTDGMNWYLSSIASGATDKIMSANGVLFASIYGTNAVICSTNFNHDKVLKVVDGKWKPCNLNDNIEIYLLGKPYTAKKGMTWAEFVNSPYNTIGLMLEYPDDEFSWIMNDIYYFEMNSMGHGVAARDRLIDGYWYGTEYIEFPEFGDTEWG